MVNLIQPITIQQAYDGITHLTRTDSRSALPREIRDWRRLRIVKHDESFSLVFSPRTRIYRVGVEVGGVSGGPRGWGARLGG